MSESRRQNASSRAGRGSVPKEGEPASSPRVLPPDEQREQLLLYAFRALGQRALSRAELERRMLRRQGDPELVESVLARVQELGYLSDELVAQVEARRRGVGSGRVRQKLRQRGVAGDLIEEVLAARDPDEEGQDARSLLERRWPSFQRAADPQKRAFAFLMRRGYASSVIWPLLREFSGRAVEFEEDFAGELE